MRYTVLRGEPRQSVVGIRLPSPDFSVVVTDWSVCGRYEGVIETAIRRRGRCMIVQGKDLTSAESVHPQ